LGFRVEASRLLVSGLGFRVSGFGSRVSGLGFRVSGLGSRVSGLGFRVSGFGSRVSGLGFRVHLGIWAALCDEHPIVDVRHGDRRDDVEREGTLQVH